MTVDHSHPMCTSGIFLFQSKGTVIGYTNVTNDGNNKRKSAERTCLHVFSSRRRGGCSRFYGACDLWLESHNSRERNPQTKPDTRTQTIHFVKN